jgi:lipoprotein-anchoring transpeptidase ErfK/SrfK
MGRGLQMRALLFAVAACLSAALLAMPSPANAMIDPATGLSMSRDGGSSGGGWGVSNRRRVVNFQTNQRPGTIIIKTREKKLYLVLGDGKAMRYAVGTGRPGTEWYGVQRVSAKREWPAWRPTARMRREDPRLPAVVPGGPNNPLGARALYLGNTLYRIHGMNRGRRVGTAASAGCIFMSNADVKDLYQRVRVGAKVIVQR